MVGLNIGGFWGGDDASRQVDEGDGTGGDNWERVCQSGYGDYLLRECVQHRLNRATDEWSICAVSERQLNHKWGSGPKKKTMQRKRKDGKKKRDAKK